MFTKFDIYVTGILIALFFQPAAGLAQAVQKKSRSKEVAADSIRNLSAVTITGSKPRIRQEIDRISYDLQADPESKSSSLLDMMRKVPMLSVDGAGNLELKGSTSYRILINGKPSAMIDRNVKEVLRSMPASTIQRIEVITTPPSRYDGEGLSGLINIITTKNQLAGYSGTLNLNATAPTGGPGAGGSFAIKTGKLGVNVFTGGGIYDTPVSSDYTNRTAVNTTLYQENTRQKDSQSGYLGTELSYEIDSLNLLSAAVNISGSEEAGMGTQSSTSQGELIQSYLLQNNSFGSGNSRDASINYQLSSSRNKKETLTFSYRYYGYGYKNQLSGNLTARVNYNQPDFLQTDTGNTNEHTLQVDYVTMFKKVGLETGLKTIFRNNNTSQLNNTQDVYAAYHSYQFSLLKLNVKAGLRLEYTRIFADFDSNQTEISQQHVNILPALALSRSIGRAATLTMGYTQRIQRPGIYQLNPFVNRSNPNLETSGNPGLKPIVANALQLGYSVQRKAFLNLSLEYTAFSSLINQVANYDPNTGITRTAYQNTGSGRLLGGNMSINYPVTAKFNASANFKMYHGRISGITSFGPVHSSGLMYSTGINLGYQFGDGWRANSSLGYRSPSFTLQRETNAQSSSSISLSKELMNNQLTCSISASNPFNKYQTNNTLLTGPDFEQLSAERNYFRSFRASINYRFGKLKDAVKKSSRSIRNDDVSN